MKSPTYYYLHSNRLWFGLIGSVNDLDAINVLAFRPLGRLRWSLTWISSLPMGLSPSYIFWPFRFVSVPVCGRFGLWPFRSVAVPVYGRSGLWPFRFVAFSVCGLSGLWPFRFVAFSVCGRLGLWPFRLWPFRFVAVMTCYRRNMFSANRLEMILLTPYHK